VTTPPDVPDLPSLEEAFELGPELGAGGFGVVHRATRRADGVDAAVKLPRADVPMAEPSRVVREARILEDLDHPHLARFLGLYRTEDDTLALVYELVPGQSLDQVLADAPLPSPRAMAILAGVAAGLDHLHRAQLIHRDLKPANVMLAPGDDPKLLDFGLARPLAPGATLTAVGIITGTPAFMAPELLEGRPATIRSDLFSFGCLAFQLLTGSPPYPSDLGEVLAAHARPEPPKASRRTPTLPRRVDAPLAAALARDPAERPPSAVALVRDLEEALADPGVASSRTVVLADAPESAAIPTPRARDKPALSPAPRRPPYLLGGLALAAVATVAVLALRLDSPAPAPTEAPLSASSGLPPGFAVDYADALDRIQRLHVVGKELLDKDQVPADAPRAFRAIREPRYWGELRRHLDPTLATFERWFAAGGRPEELPLPLLSSLRDLDSKLAAQNPTGFSPPLFPFLEAPPPIPALAPPMGHKSLGSWREHLKYVDPKALSPAGGWLGRVYAALRELHRKDIAIARKLQRMLRGEEIDLDVPTPRELGPVFMARRVQKYSTYLDHMWSQDHDRARRRRYARSILPVAEAAHRVLYAVGRALAELPESERDARSHLLFFLIENLGPVARESYLSTLRPAEVLLPVQDTLHWHMLASTHAVRVLPRRRSDSYLSSVAHLARALEHAEARPIPVALLYLIRQQVVVSGTFPSYYLSERDRTTIFQVVHQGAPQDWARYAPSAVSRLVIWHGEKPTAHTWPLADLLRVDQLLRARAEHPGSLAHDVLRRHIESFRARLARAREGG
jgi:hypothetical protein